MKRPWWQQEVTIAWAMMLVFPIGILMMWLYAPWRKRFKWIWTGVAVFAALMIIGGVFGDDSGKSTSSDTALVVTESSTKPTKTKEPTSTPKPTATIKPTKTPKATKTPEPPPTATPEPYMLLASCLSEDLIVLDTTRRWPAMSVVLKAGHGHEGMLTTVDKAGFQMGFTSCAIATSTAEDFVGDASISCQEKTSIGGGEAFFKNAPPGVLAMAYYEYPNGDAFMFVLTRSDYVLTKAIFAECTRTGG